MRLHLALLAFLIPISLFSQVSFDIEKLPDDSYGVFAWICDEDIFLDEIFVGSMQVTVKYSTSQSLTNFSPATAAWTLESPVVGPVEAPNMTYQSFQYLNGQIDLMVGEGVLLFSFFLEGANTSPILIDNDSDPFIAPNSLGLNIGQAVGALCLGCTPISQLSYSENGACGGYNLYGIKGTVRYDYEADCSTTIPEQTLPHWKVNIAGNGENYATYTNMDGKFLLGLDPGTYEVSLEPPAGLSWYPCQTPMTVIVEETDEYTNVDLKASAEFNIPLLTVSMHTPILRRCFDNNNFVVNWCNEGTVDVDSAYILVELDDLLSIVSASIAYETLGNNIFKFPLGNLKVGDCGQFKIFYHVSCDAAFNQTLCATAEIFPRALPFSEPTIGGAYLIVDGECDNQGAHFSVENIGTEDMSTENNYRILKDGTIMEEGQIQLGAGESQYFTFPADGATYRLEAEQADGLSSVTVPAETIEACVENSGDDFSTGFFLNFPIGDQGPFFSQACQTVTGSYDPNDKAAIPAGYGDEHYIEQNIPIEYKIRFQNTGNDTAFTVIVLDTLSEHLDPSTIRLGAFSHLYELSILEEHILQFTFNDIMLPDSNVNEPASNGFFVFTIAQNQDLPIGTLIENRAAIYFDYNEPVITNTVFHEIGKDFLPEIIINSLTEKNANSMMIYPNPAGNWVTIDLSDTKFDSGEFVIFNTQGKPVHSTKFMGKQYSFETKNMTSGIYYYKILSENNQVDVGKIIIQ